MIKINSSLVLLFLLFCLVTTFCSGAEVRMAAGFGVKHIVSDYDKLLTYDAFWCSKLIPLRTFKKLRVDKPSQLMLHYQSAFSVSPENPWTMPTYPKNHPEWLMRTNSGKLMRWSPKPKDPYYNRFFLDIGNPEVVAYLVDDIVSDMLQYRKDGYTFSGVALDNCLFSHWWRLKNKQHPEGWKYCQDLDEWTTNFFNYIEKLYAALKKQGFKLYINHTLEYRNKSDEKHWPRLLTLGDGFMSEFSIMSGGKSSSPPEMAQAIKHHMLVKDAGKKPWLWCEPKTKEQQELCLQVAELIDGYLTVPIKVPKK